MKENEDEPIHRETNLLDSERTISSEEAPGKQFHNALSDDILMEQDESIDGEKVRPMDKDKARREHNVPVFEDKRAGEHIVAPLDEDKPVCECRTAPADKDKPISEREAATDEDKLMSEHEAASVDKCKPMDVDGKAPLKNGRNEIITKEIENDNSNVELKSATEQNQKDSCPPVSIDGRRSIHSHDDEPSVDKKVEVTIVPDDEKKQNPECRPSTNGRAKAEAPDMKILFKPETVFPVDRTREAHEAATDKCVTKATDQLVYENGKCYEVPGSTSETLAGEKAINWISHPEYAVPAVDAKHEHSEVRGNKSGFGAPMEQSEIAKSPVDNGVQHFRIAEEGRKPMHYARSISIEHEEHSTPQVESPKIKSEPENGNMKSEKDKDALFLCDDSHEGSESGTEEEQTAFMKELERFFRERGMEFKPPKFYGEALNCLKLWRAVMKLGGYDKVTSCKLWRQVGESFRPPKTCTTVSWTFRGFYEKALFDFEKSKVQGGELNLAITSNTEFTTSDNQSPGLGRARRDAAARAMQGWHLQRVLDNGEVSDPIVKDKTSASLQKREKQLKTLDGSGSLKRKKPSDVDDAKAAPTKASKMLLDVEVIDIGSPAEWVKINVQRVRDCYEIYALVPGLLREEVRVQSDPVGRVVISGEPAHPNNPWGVAAFKKVVSLPTRIDPHQTSAVVTLHGQLYIRAPFESSA